ncbi:MAG: hypothetical protein ACYC27_16675 [Armatimonadota bacterium]
MCDTGEPLPIDHLIGLYWVTDSDLVLYKENIMSLGQNQHSRNSFADEAFTYEFTQSIEDPYISVWILNIYDLNMYRSLNNNFIHIQPVAITVPPEDTELLDGFEDLFSRI